MKQKAPVVHAVAGPAGKLNTITTGDGGLPVLFVHDNAADHTHWTETQHGLPTKSVAFDLRGLGNSEGSHCSFGIEAAVEDLSAIADALLPDRFVLIGHGFGAAAAGAFATYYPERLAGLLYVEAPGDLRQTPAKERDAFLSNFSFEKYGTFHEH